MARIARPKGGPVAIGAVALLLAPVVFALSLVTPVAAQDGTTTTTTVDAPTRDIVPKPNSGTPPAEAGDRGGALQLGLLGMLVVVIAGAVVGLVRQSRRVRGAPPG